MQDDKLNRIEDKIDHLSDRWSDRLNQIDEKWDEKFGDMYKMLHEHSLVLREHGIIHENNSKSLIEHMKRSLFLEGLLKQEISGVHEKYEPLKKKSDSLSYLAKVLSGIAIAIGSIWTLIEYFLAKK